MNSDGIWLLRILPQKKNSVLVIIHAVLDRLILISFQFQF